jgi:hypothetical protein
MVLLRQMDGWSLSRTLGGYSRKVSASLSLLLFSCIFARKPGGRSASNPYARERLLVVYEFLVPCFFKLMVALLATPLSLAFRNAMYMRRKRKHEHEHAPTSSADD